MKPAEIITNRIIEKLGKGVIVWHKGYTHNIAKNLISKKAYRGVNWLMLTYLENHSSDYWMTYKQAKKLGGHIKKGEHGTPIIFYKSYDKETDKIDDLTGKPKTEPRHAIRFYQVFNYDQTEGIEKPADEKRLDFSPIEAATHIVSNYPAPQPSIKHNGAPTPYYCKADDSIGIPAPERFDSEEKYYNTLFHELTHSTGHETRLSRQLEGMSTAKLEPYSKEELIAELGSCFLMSEAGIKIDIVIDNSAAYCAHWIKQLKKDPKFIISASAKAQKATDYILGKVNNAQT